MTQTETEDVASFETLQRPELKKAYKWIFELGAVALVLYYIIVQASEVPVSSTISVFTSF